MYQLGNATMSDLLHSVTIVYIWQSQTDWQGLIDLRDFTSNFLELS